MTGDLLQAARASCEAAEPDTKRFSSIYVSAALDAASAAGMVLDFIRTQDVQTIAEVASLCRDTVDMHIRGVEAIDQSTFDLEETILAHPLMQCELARQRRDLERSSTFSPTPEAVEALEAEWRAPSLREIKLVP